MKVLFWIIILGLVGWGIYTMIDRGERLPPTISNQQQGIDVGEPNPDSPAGGTTELAVREFTVSGKPFSYSPAILEVNEGEIVRITFVNQQGTHDLVVDGYNARTKILQSGQSETIEFLADKTGSFEFYCSIGTHREQGMKGTLIVK